MKLSRERLRTAFLTGVVFVAHLAWGGTEPSTKARLSQVATSSNGMVVSGSELATRAGAELLAAGGNAVDAAVATAFALAVVEPTQSGLGGRTQALVRRADGTTFGVDATTQVPASYDPESAEEARDGYTVIAIPGTVAGLTRLLAEGGLLPLPRVMAPAIRLAEDGFALNAGEAERLARVRKSLLRSEGARAVFLAADGSAFPEGHLLRQPALAEVLRAVASEGPVVFYEGWIAKRMVADLSANGGYVSRTDLGEYEALPSIVVDGRFGDLDIVGTYVPASGATTIEALQILDRAGVWDMGASDRILVTGKALLMAFEDRESAWKDPHGPAENARWLTSDTLASQRARELFGRSEDPASEKSPAQSESAHTTHISVVDRYGTAVAMTQSLGPTAGSRVATDGLGFLYAATLGGYLGNLEPGDRPWSSQSPLIAVRRGRPVYVMGGAGARRIISALVQTIVRLEVDGLSAAGALAAPRFHPAPTAWRFELPESKSVEPLDVASVRRAGYAVQTKPSSTYFARLNVIVVDPVTGLTTGVADPRWTSGAASGPLQ